MYCYHCGTQNADNAPFCTHCNAPLAAPHQNTAPPPPNPQPYPPFPPAYAQQPYPYPAMPQQRGLKWWQILLIVLGAILAAYAAGAGLFFFEDPPSFYSLFSDFHTDDTLYKLNETAVFQDLEVTVTGVKHSGALDSNTADTEIITVTINIKNIGDQNLMCDPDNYRMINSMGQVIHPHTNDDALTYSPYYELLPGGQATITLQYEQPLDDPDLELRYYYDYSEKPTLRFEIK